MSILKSLNVALGRDVQNGLPGHEKLTPGTHRDTTLENRKGLEAMPALTIYSELGSAATLSKASDGFRTSSECMHFKPSPA